MLNKVPWPVSKSDEIELCNLTEYCCFLKIENNFTKKTYWNKIQDLDSKY